eukprot:627584-Lingulodinium_polyedra.AAC.1
MLQQLLTHQLTAVVLQRTTCADIHPAKALHERTRVQQGNPPGRRPLGWRWGQGGSQTPSNEHAGRTAGLNGNQRAPPGGSTHVER